MHVLRNRLLAACSYLAIVGFLWTPFTLHSGMPVDSGFTYVSEISRLWNGFLNGSDLLRVYISVPYQIAYLLGEWTGFGGSWVPYQIISAALWWARGYLVFEIGRRLLPGYDVFWYLTGAFVLIHSSDETVGWVGQMHQSAYILWMLLAFYSLVRVFQGAPRIYLHLLAVALLLHLSLWTYESQIVLIAAAPFLLQYLYRLPWKRWAIVSAAWWAVPAIYVVVAAAKYSRSGGDTYQQSVLRKSWQPVALLHDWLFNIGASLSFWNWPGAAGSKASMQQLLVFAVLCTGALLLGCLALRKSSSEAIAPRRNLYIALLVGLVLVVLSFPVYLTLDSAASLWRTQILSGLGAAVVFAAAIHLLASYSPRSLQVAVITVISAAIAGYGSYSALKKAAYHRWVWERHRAVIAAVIETAPRVKPGTLVVLTNIPKNSSPLAANNLWFNVAIRLAYPGTRVDGLYFDERGAPPADSGLKTNGNGQWTLNNPAPEVLILNYQPDGSVVVARRLPDFLATDGTYAPDARMEVGAASMRVLRRFGHRLP